MNEALLKQIDQEIENVREALARDIIHLIGIRSVKGEPEPGAPFGPGPRAVLDTVLEQGKQEGFYAVKHTDGVISLSLKEGQPDLGIWLHGDVVPEGTGWQFDPYCATKYKGCIVGRGASDNKGQLCAIFHLLKIFKDLGVKLNYNPALYVGSNEETGMKDIPPFLEQCTPPRLSLVPDAGFPVGYGCKGYMSVTFRSKKPLNDLQITAGQEISPGKAIATYFGKSVITNSPPRHPSEPDPNGNMITRLMEKLLNSDEIKEENRPALKFFKLVSLDIHGDQFGINVKTNTMRPLTVFAQKISMIDDHAELTANICYPIEITEKEITTKMNAVAEEYGFTVVDSCNIFNPYLLGKDWVVVTRLTEIAKEITGDERDAYTLSGGTYANVLPNALVYGINGCLKPEGFPVDRGGIHGIDELVSLDRLESAMKIYARAFLALNDMEW